MTRRRSRLAPASILVLTLGTQACAASPQSTQPADGTSEAELRATARFDEVRQQREAYEAEQLTAQAAREEVRGRDRQAEALYAKALELDPSNTRARLGLHATRDRLGLTTERLPLIERVERESKARRQEVLYRFNAAISAAGDGIAAGTPEGFLKARLAIDRARLAREASPGDFSDEDRRLLDASLRDKDAALRAAVQQREAAVERARQKDWARRIKAARVHDIRLEL